MSNILWDPADPTNLTKARDRYRRARLDTDALLTPHVLLLRLPTGVTDEEIRTLVQTSADEMDTVLIALQDALLAIAGANGIPGGFAGGPTMSPAGYAARANAGRRARSALQAQADVALRALRPREATHAVILTPSFRWQVTGLSDDDARQLASEIRARFYLLPVHERRTRYLAAAKKGDSLTLRAVEQAPSSDPILADKLGDADERAIREGARRYAEAKVPERYDLLTQLRIAIYAVEMNHRRAVTHIKQASGIDVGHPPSVTRWPDEDED